MYCRLRPEAEVSAHVEGSLSAEVTSIVLDALEQLVQVSVLCVFKGGEKVYLEIGRKPENISFTKEVNGNSKADLGWFAMERFHHVLNERKTGHGMWPESLLGSFGALQLLCSKLQ